MNQRQAGGDERVADADETLVRYGSGMGMMSAIGPPVEEEVGVLSSIGQQYVEADGQIVRAQARGRQGRRPRRASSRR